MSLMDDHNQENREVTEKLTAYGKHFPHNRGSSRRRWRVPKYRSSFVSLMLSILV